MGSNFSGTSLHNTEVSFDKDNQEQMYAYNMIARTNNSLFLTGRAGTGKTTFLQNVLKSVNKRFIVLAPTGIAAINAGGQTIHSFFGFDFAVQGPRSKGSMSDSKIDLVKNIDAIIIDEVSMVRCDLMDAIDRMLRMCRNSSQPFGGIQMVLVGDLFQLPPVVKDDAKEALHQIYGHYNSMFYKAHCIERLSMPTIEFRKIYRQTDPYFIEMLDRFRTGEAGMEDIEEINTHIFFPGLDEEDNRITITSYKKDAQAINESRLKNLEGESYTYEAEYEGNCSSLKQVVEDILELKEGAQVMFLKNDPDGRWVNGTIAHVCRIDDDEIYVSLENSEEEIPVEREKREAIEYTYDKELKCCKKEVVGSVTQFPLRLAWAMTIHKSQSLTFDKVAIDFGRGAFSCGQAYVALSRVRSLEGLRLVRPMDISSVKVSKDVLMFATTFNDEELISKELEVGEAVIDFERNNDYDGAAVKLFRMCDEAAHQGEVFYAYELLKRSLSYLADDSCLFGQEWRPIGGMNKESNMLNAAGYLYSGRTDDALALLASTVKADDDDFNGLYLLARALEIKEEWDTVGELYTRMMAIFQETTGNGLDSTSFRKFKYRLALQNEYHFGKSGVELLVKLISENPYYDGYHSQLRRMLRNHAEEIDYKKSDSNTLMNALFDEDVSDEDFIARISEERENKTVLWLFYRLFVKRLKIKGKAEVENQ